MIDFETRRERFYTFFQSLSEDVKLSVIWGLVILGIICVIMTTVVVYNAVDDPGPPETVEEVVCEDATFSGEREMIDLCRDLMEKGDKQ